MRITQPIALRLDTPVVGLPAPSGAKLAPRPIETAPKSRKRDLGALLEKAWTLGRIAAVNTPELREAVRLLIADHLAAGRYGKILEGMQHLRGLGPDGTLEVMLNPERVNVPEGRDRRDPGACVFCTPPGEQKALRWRNFVIWPNAYPYVPPALEHVVISSRKHVGQDFDARAFGDLIQYQRAVGTARSPITLHYNGITNNSQFHRHWQGTKAQLPLTRLLNERSLKTKVLRQQDSNRILKTQHEFFRELYILEGDGNFVQRAAQRVVQALKDHPATRGHYNMLLLPTPGNRVRLVIIPRRADNTQPQIKGHGPVSMGAFSMGGLIHLPLKKIDDPLLKVYTEAARQSIATGLETIDAMIARDDFLGAPCLPIKRWLSYPAPASRS